MLKIWQKHKAFFSLLMCFVTATAASFARHVFALELENPLGNIDDPRIFIGRIIRGILGISGAVALLLLIYGGFVYLVSQGERDRVERGKQTIVWATLGLVVIFGSYAFLTYLMQALIGTGV